MLLLNCSAVLMAGLLCAQQAEFVGSSGCSGCHHAIYESYMRTGMGHSMRPASNLDLPQVDLRHARPERRFRVFRQDKDLYQSEYGLDAAGNQVFEDTHKLEFAIGSGVNGYSFAVRRGNYLFEAPLSYYVKSARWDLSPGYESADLGFSRPIAATCVGCHSGRARLIAGRDGLYDDPPFDELAIGCENCHGPGALHVAQVKPGTIVNPARLPARLAEEICIICHQRGDARVPAPGKVLSDFRPGMWSSEVLAIFKLPSSQAERSDLLEHHTAMRASRCFGASGGKLSCLTCHDPHVTPERGETAAYYRSKCLTCHSDVSCGLPQSARLQRAANDCTACHMPKRDVTVVSHAALTNHRIPARPGQEPVRDSSATSLWRHFGSRGDLMLVNAPPDPNPLPALTMLLAYGQVAAKRPAYAQRYLALLDQLSRTQPDDAVVLAAVGRKAMFDPEPDAAARARNYLEKAIEKGFTAPSTFEGLAEVLVRGGQREQAIAVLEQGLALSPYSPVLYKSLARTYGVLGRRAEVRKTLVRYLELFPEDDTARRLLR